MTSNHGLTNVDIQIVSKPKEVAIIPKKHESLTIFIISSLMNNMGDYLRDLGVRMVILGGKSFLPVVRHKKHDYGENL